MWRERSEQKTEITEFAVSLGVRSLSPKSPWHTQPLLTVAFAPKASSPPCVFPQLRDIFRTVLNL